MEALASLGGIVHAVARDLILAAVLLAGLCKKKPKKRRKAEVFDWKKEDKKWELQKRQSQAR